MTGSNSDGDGSPASVTVTVNSTATAAPVCTLTSYSPTFNPGDEVLLTANCTPAATSWVWIGGGCAGKNTAGCSDYPKVATTYTVIASNDKWKDSPRSVTVTPSGTTPTPTPTPTISCSLTASPSTSIAPGATVTLTAICTPGATSYVWSGGSCAGQTASSCTVTPTATTSYSVIASNDTGSDSKRTIFVTPSTSTPSSACTLIATPSSVAVGGLYTLTGQCGNLLMLGYKWSGEGCTSAIGASCTVKSTKTGVFPYTVAFTLPAGVTTLAAATVTVTPPSAAKPVCTLMASPFSVTAGSPVTLTASCTPAGTYTYTWSDTSCAGTSASCTVKPSADTTYSVKGSHAGVDSDLQSVAVQVVPATSYQGLWWNPTESGWGISVTQHSDKIFAAIYTYDAAGQPTWYSLSDCPILAAKTNGCTGDIYKLTGGSSPLVVPWKTPSAP